ncbi:MAG: hypothetical protein GZ088_01550 [Acidipila sp.]|nr:hypothetical protein [Acidipila sp.]
MYTCRSCEREINTASELCPYCGEDLTVLPQVVRQDGAQDSVHGGAAALAKKPSVLQRTLRWTLVLATLCGFLWYILFLPQRTGNSARAEHQAVISLEETLRALNAYADAQGGSYPQALESLGRGVQQTAQQALAEGYQLEYVSGERGENGGVSHFVLLARPQNYGYRNFYADESGILRATLEWREATAKDPPFAGNRE